MCHWKVNMFNQEEKAHYQRHFVLPGFGEEKQALLREARVLVIGAGGLGCPALQYLAAAGIGTIGIVDGDQVEKSNLHRQVLYGVGDVGQNKAECARNRLQSLNPYITIHSYTEFLTSQNALELIADYDLVLDGSDNFQARYLVNDACVMLDKPFVYGAIYTFQGQISVFNYQEGPTYRCLYPEPPAPESAPNCAEIGVLGVLPGIIGTYQALEVIKLVAGLDQVLSGKLLIIDTLTQEHLKLEISLNPENKRIDHLIDYDAFCGVVKSRESFSWQQFESVKETVMLLDVREPHEYMRFHVGGKNIPLGELKKHLATLPKDRQIITVCQSGKRSAIAQKLLLEEGFQKVFNLEGGYNAR